MKTLVRYALAALALTVAVLAWGSVERNVATAHGFNRRSHHARARVPISGMERAGTIAGGHCGLAPRFGFNNSASFASC